MREDVNQLFFACPIGSPVFYPGVKRAQQIIHRETRTPGTDVLKTGQSKRLQKIENRTTAGQSGWTTSHPKRLSVQ